MSGREAREVLFRQHRHQQGDAGAAKLCADWRTVVIVCGIKEAGESMSSKPTIDM